MSAAEGRAAVQSFLPPGLSERAAWARDIDKAFTALQLPLSAENICAVIAITEQESGFRADPSVPGLPAIAWKEIDRRAERLGIPKLVAHGALMVTSSDGRSYAERIDRVQTERQLSEIYEDLIAMVPLGKTFFADRNPVRTGGPMQVSVAFAEAHARAKTYPYPVATSIRHEVFTRRGGLYFGVAHLLDYPAAYDSNLYRYADFNAGRYASRNAAFQNALTVVSGIPLELDGDLLRYDGGQALADPGHTELAARTIARRLHMDFSDIRRDLERGKYHDFESTSLYTRLFELTERTSRKALPRAVLPQLELQSPKIRRKLTTAWFANRVDERARACLARMSRASNQS